MRVEVVALSVEDIGEVYQTQCVHFSLFWRNKLMRNQSKFRRINSRRLYESRDMDVLRRNLDSLCDTLSDTYGANIASNKVIEEYGDLVAWITIRELDGFTMDISVRMYGNEQYGFGYEAVFYLDDDYVSDYMPTLKFRTEEDAILSGVEDAMEQADKHNYWLDMDYSGYDEDGGDYYDSEYESRNRNIGRNVMNKHQRLESIKCKMRRHGR